MIQSFKPDEIESQVERKKFLPKFNLVTQKNPQFLGQNKDNKDLQPLVTSKQRLVITDAGKKTPCDYYFNLLNGKLAQKVIRTWFL